MFPRTPRALALLTGSLLLAGVVTTVDLHPGRAPASATAPSLPDAGGSAASAPASSSSTDGPGASSPSATSTGVQAASAGTSQGSRRDPGAAPSSLARQRPAPVVATSPLLPGVRRGVSAIQDLGPRLGEAARRNQTSVARLRQVLSTDDTARLGRSGRLFYVEHPAPSAAADTVTPGPSAGASGATAQSSSTDTPAYPTSQTFSLHSRPGASRVIYLDAVGADVSGTAWNPQMDSGHYPGINDGSTTFTTAQHAWIQEVWRQVAETYSPFDVDVTTEDPGTDALTRTSSSDQSFGTRVVLTSSTTAKSQGCGGGNCLGVAYVGTFDNVGSAYYQPAWVFVDASTATNPGAIVSATIAAQGAAHEAGHNLGLSHDGQGTSPYYAGADGDWGPVMGSATNRALTQWSQGEYTGATNHEDDLAVMQQNGAPLRADDHGDTLATATALGAAPSYAAAGVISTRADQDVFTVDRTCSGSFTAAANGIGAQTTLDLSLTVKDTSGNTLASASPVSGFSGWPWPVSTGMNASVSTTLPTGTYQLVVDGVGNGDPTTNGWSDYASLGQYTLTASGCDTVATPTASPTAGPTSSPTTGPTAGSSPTVDPSATPTTSGPTPTSGPTSTSGPTPTSAPTTPATTPTTPGPTVPGAPRIGPASSGAWGRPITATARWWAPSSTGGSQITAYQVTASMVDSRGRVMRVYRLTVRPRAAAMSLTLGLPRGRYVFRVQARNAVGSSAWSAASGIVTAR